ncbi:hypothetical protein EI981_06225 [Paenibacillus lutimineralis]|uniref:Uncharacterized protein n=1 Tax=Paenibacillus lutimineralis TaxID=2707005 RepID=A0A3Q9I9D0_9BACL|nr:hypothetical protein EI981_06225 [Paenibacillus lutimineralis]
MKFYIARKPTDESRSLILGLSSIGFLIKSGLFEQPLIAKKRLQPSYTGHAAFIYYTSSSHSSKDKDGSAFNSRSENLLSFHFR